MFDLTDNRVVIFLIFALGSIFTFFKFFIRSDRVKNSIEGNKVKIYLLIILIIAITFSHFYIKRELYSEYRINSWWFCKKIDCRKKSEPPEKLRYGISEALKGNE